MRIELVATEHVPRIWPMVEKYFSSALEHAKGDYSVEEAKTLLAMGNWVMVVALDDNGVCGAAAVSFTNRPSARVAFITAIGGRLISSNDTFGQLKNLLASLGATHIEGAARESVARLWSRFGFESKYQVVGVQI